MLIPAARAAAVLVHSSSTQVQRPPAGSRRVAGHAGVSRHRRRRRPAAEGVAVGLQRDAGRRGEGRGERAAASENDARARACQGKGIDSRRAVPATAEPSPPLLPTKKGEHPGFGALGGSRGRGEGGGGKGRAGAGWCGAHVVVPRAQRQALARRGRRRAVGQEGVALRRRRNSAPTKARSVSSRSASAPSRRRCTARRGRARSPRLVSGGRKNAVVMALGDDFGARRGDRGRSTRSPMSCSVRCEVDSLMRTRARTKRLKNGLASCARYISNRVRGGGPMPDCMRACVSVCVCSSCPDVATGCRRRAAAYREAPSPARRRPSSGVDGPSARSTQSRAPAGSRRRGADRPRRLADAVSCRSRLHTAAAASLRSAAAEGAAVLLKADGQPRVRVDRLHRRGRLRGGGSSASRER